VGGKSAGFRLGVGMWSGGGKVRSGGHGGFVLRGFAGISDKVPNLDRVSFQRKGCISSVICTHCKNTHTCAIHNGCQHSWTTPQQSRAENEKEVSRALRSGNSVRISATLNSPGLEWHQKRSHVSEKPCTGKKIQLHARPVVSQFFVQSTFSLLLPLTQTNPGRIDRPLSRDIFDPS